MLRILRAPRRNEKSVAAWLDARNIRNDAARRVHRAVPGLKALVEVRELVPAIGKPDGLVRAEDDAVLVPGDVPGDRDHDVRIRPGQRKEAHARLAEALRDARDGTAESASVEQLGRL